MEQESIWAIYLALEKKLIRSDDRDEKEKETITKQLNAIATLLPKNPLNRNNLC